MCIHLRKKKKDSRQEIFNGTSCSSSGPDDNQGSGASKSMAGRSPDAKDNTMTASSILGTEEDVTQREDDFVKKQEKRLNAVYKAMGAEPNNALARKLDQDKKKKEVSLDKMEKYGDIGFHSACDDPFADTVYEPKKTPQNNQTQPKRYLTGKKPPPKQKAYAYKRTKQEPAMEQPMDVDFDPANENNFMANLGDIAYTAHEMIRKAKRRDMTTPKDTQGVSPWGSLASLESDPRFRWNALRSNTFLSNALSLPTHLERDLMPTAKEDIHLQWIIPAMKLSEFNENEEQKTCRSIALPIPENNTMEDE